MRCSSRHEEADEELLESADATVEARLCEDVDRQELREAVRDTVGHSNDAPRLAALGSALFRLARLTEAERALERAEAEMREAAKAMAKGDVEGAAQHQAEAQRHLEDAEQGDQGGAFCGGEVPGSLPNLHVEAEGLERRVQQ